MLVYITSMELFRALNSTLLVYTVSMGTLSTIYTMHCFVTKTSGPLG